MTTIYLTILGKKMPISGQQFSQLKIIFKSLNGKDFMFTVDTEYYLMYSYLHVMLKL